MKLLLILLSIFSVTVACDAASGPEERATVERDVTVLQSQADLERQLAILNKRAMTGRADFEFEYFDFVFKNMPALEAHAVTALHRLESAAKKNNALAQTRLGFMLNTGTFLPINKDSGLYWLLLAGQQGNVKAQRLLGAEFASRAVESKDVSQVTEYRTNSIQWLRRAEDQGDIEAKSLLGKILAMKQETRLEGIALIKEAAELGSENAKEALQLISSEVESTGNPQARD